MPRVRFSKRSRADLNEIFDHIAVNSPRSAQRTIDRIVEQAAKLRDQPLMGHRRDNLRLGIRSLRYERYVILYELIAECIVIAHVVHHARDLPAIVARDTHA